MKLGDRISLQGRQGVITGFMPEGMVDVRLDGDTFTRRCSADRLAAVARQNSGRPTRPPRKSRARRNSDSDKNKTLSELLPESFNFEALNRRISRQELDIEDLADRLRPLSMEKRLELMVQILGRSKFTPTDIEKARTEEERVQRVQLEAKKRGQVGSRYDEMVAQIGQHKAMFHAREDRPRIAKDQTGQFAYCGNPIDGVAYYAIVSSASIDRPHWVLIDEVFAAARDARVFSGSGYRTAGLTGPGALTGILRRSGFYEQPLYLQHASRVFLGDRLVPWDRVASDSVEAVQVPVGEIVRVETPDPRAYSAVETFFLSTYQDEQQSQGARLQAVSPSFRALIRQRKGKRGQKGLRMEETPEGASPGKIPTREPIAGVDFVTGSASGEPTYYIEHRREAAAIDRLKRFFQPYTEKRFVVTERRRWTPQDEQAWGELPLWIHQLSGGTISREVALDLVRSGAVAVKFKTGIETNPFAQVPYGTMIRVTIRAKAYNPLFSWVRAVVPFGKEESETCLSKFDRQVLNELRVMMRVVGRTAREMRRVRRFLFDAGDPSYPKPPTRARAVITVIEPPRTPGDILALGDKDIEVPPAASRQEAAANLHSLLEQAMPGLLVKSSGNQIELIAKNPGRSGNSVGVGVLFNEGGGYYRITPFSGGSDGQVTREIRSLVSAWLSLERWLDMVQKRSGIDPVYASLLDRIDNFVDKNSGERITIFSSGGPLDRGLQEIKKLLVASGVQKPVVPDEEDEKGKKKKREPVGLRRKTATEEEQVAEQFLNHIRTLAGVDPLLDWLEAGEGATGLLGGIPHPLQDVMRQYPTQGYAKDANEAGTQGAILWRRGLADQRASAARRLAETAGKVLLEIPRKVKKTDYTYERLWLAQEIINEQLPRLTKPRVQGGFDWSMNEASDYGTETYLLGLMYLFMGGPDLSGPFAHDRLAQLTASSEDQDYFSRTMRLFHHMAARMTGGAAGLGSGVRQETYVTYNPVLFDVTRRFFGADEEGKPFRGVLGYPQLAAAIDAAGVYGHAVALTQEAAALKDTIAEVSEALTAAVAHHVIESTGELRPARTVLTGYQSEMQFPRGYFDDFVLNWRLGASYAEADAAAKFWVESPLDYISQTKTSLELLMPHVWQVGTSGISYGYRLSDQPTEDEITKALQLLSPKRMSSPDQKSRIAVIKDLQNRAALKVTGEPDEETVDLIRTKLEKGTGAPTPRPFFGTETYQVIRGKMAGRRPDLPENATSLELDAQQAQFNKLLQRIDKTQQQLIGKRRS